MDFLLEFLSDFPANSSTYLIGFFIFVSKSMLNWLSSSISLALSLSCASKISKSSATLSLCLQQQQQQHQVYISSKNTTYLTVISIQKLLFFYIKEKNILQFRAIDFDMIKKRDYFDPGLPLFLLLEKKKFNPEQDERRREAHSTMSSIFNMKICWLFYSFEWT